MILVFWTEPQLLKSFKHTTQPWGPIPSEIPIPLGFAPGVAGIDYRVNTYTGEPDIGVNAGVGVPGNSAGIYADYEGPASLDAGLYGQVGLPWDGPNTFVEASLFGNGVTFGVGDAEWTLTKTGEYQKAYVLTTDQTIQTYGGYEAFARRELKLVGDISWAIYATAPSPYSQDIKYYHSPIKPWWPGGMR